MCPTPAETCGNKPETRLSACFCHADRTSQAPTRFLDVPNTLGNTWKHAGNKALGPFLPRWPQKLSPNTLPRCAQHPRKHMETSQKQSSRPVSATQATQVKPPTRFLDVPSTLGNTWEHAGNKALGPFLPRWPQKLSPNTLPRCAQRRG